MNYLSFTKYIISIILFSFQFAQAQELFVKVRIEKNLIFNPQIRSQLKILNKFYHQSKIQKDSGLYDVIALVPMTDYLAGVVSKEMPLSWPKEALKAQAVVARSYLLSKMLERKNKNFHVDRDQMDQVFDFTTSQKAFEVVRETEGIFLMDDRNKILRTFYHSDCGGQTIKATDVWGGDVFDSGTAVDSWCKNRKSNEWAYEINKVDFFNQGQSAPQIKKYENKILSIYNQSIQSLRQKFGFNLIRSSPMDVTESPDKIIFSGKGYGHGVGLCQWGARAQADLGMGYLDILRHYYPKALLSNDRQKLAYFKNKLLTDLTIRM